MQYCIISGSSRNHSQSIRVATYVKARIASELGALGAAAEILDLSQLELPYWDESIWDKEPAAKWTQSWTPVRTALNACDGVIIIAPEWAGMVPPALKNFLLLAATSGQILAHKPGMIFGISSGMGGTYPVAELHQFGTKNTRLCYVPDHIIIRQVETYLQGDTPTNDIDKNLRARIDYSLKVFHEYAKAMRSVRESPIIDYKSFPFGM
jgi:NAD(P)H-dependent FMN reductase